MMKKTLYNSFLFGIITGVVIQLVAFSILIFVYKSLVGFTERSVFDFLSYLMDYDTGRTLIIPKLLSLSVIADLLLFFIFIWTDRLNSGKGAIGSAFLMGIPIVIFKLL